MAKNPKLAKSKYGKKPFYQSGEWRVQYRNGYSEIEIYDPAVNGWLSAIHVKEKCHPDIADFVTAVINTHNQKIDKYEEAIKALELCLESSDLSWEAEQAADIVIKRSEKIIAVTASNNKVSTPTKKLTPRELEVITHTAYGANRSDIAQLLHISEETVKVYVERICRKLNAANKTHATVIALSLGMIEPCEFSDSEINEQAEFVPHTGNPRASEISVLPTHTAKKQRV